MKNLKEIFAHISSEDNIKIFREEVTKVAKECNFDLGTAPNPCTPVLANELFAKACSETLSRFLPEHINGMLKNGFLHRMRRENFEREVIHRLHTVKGEIERGYTEPSYDDAEPYKIDETKLPVFLESLAKRVIEIHNNVLSAALNMQAKLDEPRRITERPDRPPYRLGYDRNQKAPQR
jgi:hypothetical protein